MVDLRRRASIVSRSIDDRAIQEGAAVSELLLSVLTPSPSGRGLGRGLTEANQTFFFFLRVARVNERRKGALVGGVS